MPNIVLLRLLNLTLSLFLGFAFSSLHCGSLSGQVIAVPISTNAGFEDGLTNWQASTASFPGEVVQRDWSPDADDPNESSLEEFFFRFDSPGLGEIRQIIELANHAQFEDQVVVCHGHKNGSGLGLFGVNYYDQQGKLVGRSARQLSPCGASDRGLGDGMSRHHVSVKVPASAVRAQLWACNVGIGEMLIDELALVNVGLVDQTDQILNGSFETGTYSPLFNGSEFWTLRAGSVAEFGENLFGLPPSMVIGSSTKSNLVYQNVTVSPGSLYEFSTKYVRGGALGIAGVYFKNDAGNTIETKKIVLNDITMPEPNEPTPIASTTIQAPTLATKAMVWVWTRKTPAASPANELSRLLVYDVSLDLKPSRNALKQPFASESIWNMPIGSDAQYTQANIKPSTQAGMTVDEDIIILKPNAPLTSIYQNFTAWNSSAEGARCLIQGRNLGKFPIPTDYSRPQPEGTTENNAAAILSPDGRTISQNQPFTRCPGRKFATSLYVYEDVDLYGMGLEGAHGGSGLSSIGGTIRLGELVPGGSIPHVVKLNLFSQFNYYRSLDEADGNPGFRWPARWADIVSPTTYRGSNPSLQMGSLLAIHKDVDLSANQLELETEAAQILAKALQDYGGYTVDDAAWDVYAIATEHGPDGNVVEEFESQWGFKLQDFNKNTPWGRDMDRIFTSLYVIDNNSPSSVGGGGTPRVPLAPQLIVPN